MSEEKIRFVIPQPPTAKDDPFIKITISEYGIVKNVRGKQKKTGGSSFKIYNFNSLTPKKLRDKIIKMLEKDEL